MKWFIIINWYITIVVRFHCRNKHVMKFDDQSYLVLSHNGSCCYSVRVEREGGSLEYTCTCPQFSFRKDMCKHMFAVGIENGFQREHMSNKKRVYHITPGRPRRQRPVAKRRRVDKE